MTTAGMIGGAGVGGVMGIFQGLIEQEFAEKNMRKAQHYAQRMARNRYQWARQDLEAAGLNPMLAFGGVPMGHSAPPPATPRFPIAERAMAGARLSAEIDLLDQQADLAKANAAKVRAETPKAELGGQLPRVINEVLEGVRSSAREAGVSSPSDLIEKVVEGVQSVAPGGSFWKEPEIEAIREGLKRWVGEKLDPQGRHFPELKRERDRFRSRRRP